MSNESNTTKKAHDQPNQKPHPIHHHLLPWAASHLAERSAVFARTDLALNALEQALYERSVSPRDGLVHHGDRGSQYLSICYTERLAEAGIKQSVGSVGDSYDNALAESIIGLYKRAYSRKLDTDSG